MKKILWILFLILIIGTVVFAIYKNNNKQVATENKNEYVAQRVDTTIKNENIQNNLNNQITKEEKDEENEEEELSEFSTKLPKDTKERYSNIELACNTLNGTIIKAGDTFSLWNELGCPTEEKGYRKAKAFTPDGGVKKSYGGGICQVSTTIYNAVLEVEGLEVKERHEHSRDVVYIKDGKDAAVSYKSADLKFKNTLDYDVRLEAKVENNKIKIKLIRI